MLKKMAVVAGICGGVCDEALKLIFKDDRIPRQIGAITLAIRTQIRNVDHLSDAVWIRLGGICDKEWKALRSMTISASIAAAGFIHMHLRRARRGIWAYLQGDRTENLRKLAAGPAPVLCDNVFKMYELMRL